jgi:hypothetical protein
MLCLVPLDTPDLKLSGGLDLEALSRILRAPVT